MDETEGGHGWLKWKKNTEKDRRRHTRRMDKKERGYRCRWIQMLRGKEEGKNG